MRMVDIIAHKRNGNGLTGEEIAFVVKGCTDGSIPDYQLSALMMAVYFQGMDAGETAALTLAMAKSGDVVDLSSIPGVKVDKHSTGGVGDKTTLVVAPIVASLGVPVAKMSGRGLGHTGGTVDKVEAIPGYRTTLDREEFLSIVREHGISVAGQSGNLAPADKKLYALRDVTATVESIPLIAASVMSKKIAAGADAIVLDVKMGSGAFCKTLEEAQRLAGEMVAIGEGVGRSTIALITDMDVPLGYGIGNSLEIAESVQTLAGDGPEDLTLLSIELAANMLVLAGKGDLETCRKLAQNSIADGSALGKLREMVEAHGGDPAYIDDPDRFGLAQVHHLFTAREDGVIQWMDCQGIGTASSLLGAGRKDKDDTIDPLAGIQLRKKTGDAVHKGEVIATLYTSDAATVKEAEDMMEQSVRIGTAPPQPRKLIACRIDKEGTTVC